MGYAVKPSFFFPPADTEENTVSIQIKLENEGSDEEIEMDVLYSPQMALKLAITEWMQEFGVPHQYNCKHLTTFSLKVFPIGDPQSFILPNTGM